jgi:hypothetical protein
VSRYVDENETEKGGRRGDNLRQGLRSKDLRLNKNQNKNPPQMVSNKKELCEDDVGIARNI